jgi:uncharacterized repeat protein (TIGR02543 family)/prepilin-type N-terminal cleavage/methylation domain-containing protein
VKNKKGITLIEVILTLAILAIVIPVVYSVFFAGVTSYSFSTNKGFAQQDLRRTADYLTNELRFVTDINDEALNSGEYFSLQVNGNGDLIKTKHVLQVDGTILKSIMNTFPGNWSSIHIKNDISGVINIGLRQVENTGMKDAGYELSQSISTENSANMLNNLDVDLVQGDILYYQNTKLAALANDIYLTKPEEAEGTNIVVNFYKNDGTNNLHHTILGEGGSLKNLPSSPTRSGYTFSEWTTNADGTGTPYGSNSSTTFTMPTNNTNLYAKWVETGTISKVQIDTAAGTDGVVKLDEITNPTKNKDGYFEVNKNIGSTIKLKLLGYTSSHGGKVTVSVNNTNIAVETGGYISFKAKTDNNGNNNKFYVQVIIRTEGYKDPYTKTYNFITSN